MEYSKYLLRELPQRITNITPFTYRDGYTFLQILEDLRRRDGEIVDNINEGLNTLSEEYNGLIAKLLTDFESRLAEYDLLPEQINKILSDLRGDIEAQFVTLENNLSAKIDKHLTDDSLPVFNWLTGTITPVADYHRGEDNHQYDHGMTAADYSRVGYTVAQIDALPNVITMATRGREYCPEINPHYITSHLTGALIPVARANAHAVEIGIRGAVTIGVASDDMGAVSDFDNYLASN